jgi:hypothetical protein
MPELRAEPPPRRFFGRGGILSGVSLAGSGSSMRSSDAGGIRASSRKGGTVRWGASLLAGAGSNTVLSSSGGGGVLFTTAAWKIVS